jgi:hypothetical protein
MIEKEDAKSGIDYKYERIMYAWFHKMIFKEDILQIYYIMLSP